MSDIFVGQTLKLQFTIVDQDGNVVDLTNVITKDLCFVKPDKTIISRPTTFTTDGSDGVIEYTTVSADLDLAGSWKVQAKIIDAGNEDYPSEIVEFSVLNRVNC